MSIKINIGGVDVTSQRIDKLKKYDDVSTALTIWEKIQKFFHVGNIEEKEKILSLIKDVFINKECDLYQKIESFEIMKELSKKSNSRDAFKIELVDDLLCLSIGDVGIKHIFTKDEDIVEIEKIKKIQEALPKIKINKNIDINNSKLFEYLILTIIDKKESNCFDENGMINIDNIDQNKINIVDDIINDMKNKINDEVIDKSIFYSDNIKNIKKCTEKLGFNNEELMSTLSNALKINEKKIENDNDKELNEELEKITNTLYKDLLRMDYTLFNENLVDMNILRSETEKTETIKSDMMNDGLEKIQKLFKDTPIDKKILIYNLISQGVFQIVKDYFNNIDPLILLGISPIEGKSTVMIDKDKNENITITISNKKTLNEKDNLGKKNAESFFSKYINQGLTCYTKSKINLLHFLCDNAPNKPSNLTDVLNILDENHVYQELDPSKNISLLEENMQLVFTYNVKNQSISIDPQKSYYEYSYLNI